MNKGLMDYIDRKTSRRDYTEHEMDHVNDRRSRRDYRDEHDYRDDYEDSRDYGKRSRNLMRIRKSDMKHWKHNMQNADGTKGEHYTMEQVVDAAEKLGVKYVSFDEIELCIATNMMYSDYCRVIRNYVPKDMELMMCVELAKAFLDDEDGPEASEKLALYYYCIVDSE
jgi:hypothetical protein